MEHMEIGVNLSDFVTTNTRKFFVAPEIPQDLLQQHPSEWKWSSEQIRGLCHVKASKAVSDAATHGVLLIQSFNSVISNQEELKQLELRGEVQTQLRKPKEIYACQWWLLTSSDN